MIVMEIYLYTLKNKRVAIDTSIFLYKSLINVRYNGDYLKNKEGKILSGRAFWDESTMTIPDDLESFDININDFKDRG